MKTYHNFNEMLNAQSGIKSTNVFNRRSSDVRYIEPNDIFVEYTDRWLPDTFEGKNQLERVLIGVNKLLYEYENNGVCLNHYEGYDHTKDPELTDNFKYWLEGGGSVVADFIRGTDFDPVDYDDFDEEEEDYEDVLSEYLASNRYLVDQIARNRGMRETWYLDYYVGKDSDGYDGVLGADEEEHNWLDDYAGMIIDADPRLEGNIEALCSADTDEAYARELKELVNDVVSYIPEYEGGEWRFKDIPENEVKGWFK